MKKLNVIIRRKSPGATYRVMEDQHRALRASYPIETHKQNLIDAHEAGDSYAFKDSVLKMKYDPSLTPKDHYEIIDHVREKTNYLGPNNYGSRALSPHSMLSAHRRYIKNTRDK